MEHFMVTVPMDDVDPFLQYLQDRRILFRIIGGTMEHGYYSFHMEQEDFVILLLSQGTVRRFHNGWPKH